MQLLSNFVLCILFSKSFTNSIPHHFSARWQVEQHSVLGRIRFGFGICGRLFLPELGTGIIQLAEASGHADVSLGNLWTNQYLPYEFFYYSDVQKMLP